jgi:hypothetical protein
VRVANVLASRPGAHVCSGFLPGGSGHAVQCIYVVYVCDDANECICIKILRRLNISCTLHEMMVVLVQKINFAHKE